MKTFRLVGRKNTENKDAKVIKTKNDRLQYEISLFNLWK